MKLLSGLAAVALAATTLTQPAYAAPLPTSPTADRAVQAGATWLSGQLTNGLVFNDQFGGFNDYGLSADFAFALKAVGKDATASSIVDAIEPVSDSWATGGTFAPNRVYAGSLAKLVSVAQATGKDATDFNGTDQVTRLEDLVSSSAPLVGRLEDAGVDTNDPFDSDFVNVIGQSFAARALTTAASTRAADATTFLLDQQCDAGFFRAQLNGDKADTQQGCTSADTGSVDTTALAVINILDTPGASRTARGAAALAADWLKGQQAADGSFSAGASEGYNANTTGLAGWALSRAGESAAAAKAATWLRAVQIADLAACATKLAADNGGVAYKPSILAAARTSGIAAAARDQYRRATAQALPALASAPAANGTLGLSAPASAVERSTVTVNVTGLGQGEAACVTLGSVAKPVTGTGSTVPVSFDLPAGVGARTFTLTTLSGASSATTAATATPPTVGKLAAARVEKVTRNRFTLSVACESNVACAGTLKVRSAGKVKLANGKKRELLLAKKAYTVTPGTTADVTLKLTKAARSALGTMRLRVVAVQRTSGAEPASTKFWLKRA
ncbi:hypothetical protein J2X46_004385 [Nocardioides sp. BE266]|uniref:hypothetical protein n=1 Tax=Nocardioides sp. BE266 TaxID=2817725 RepID=UPI00285B75A1|nr:hypothetical protein [Nocardioides sp. BE266]MDR7255383.1 hypothetical protein [Nocardioides sp. BE266]